MITQTQSAASSCTPPRLRVSASPRLRVSPSVIPYRAPCIVQSQPAAALYKTQPAASASAPSASGQTQTLLTTQHPQIFDNTHNKSRYTIDTYFVEIGQPMTTWHIKNITYWYSMWSHRRNATWKGFVQVALDPIADAHARTQL
jgi:hypothetical protein